MFHTVLVSSDLPRTRRLHLHVDLLLPVSCPSQPSPPGRPSTFNPQDKMPSKSQWKALLRLQRSLHQHSSNTLIPYHSPPISPSPSSYLNPPPPQTHKPQIPDQRPQTCPTPRNLQWVFTLTSHNRLAGSPTAKSGGQSEQAMPACVARKPMRSGDGVMAESLIYGTTWCAVQQGEECGGTSTVSELGSAEVGFGR